MVAKSYQNLPVIGEPYEKNNRKYIIVECKNGHRKEVRFYTEAEYAKLYPAESPSKATSGEAAILNRLRTHNLKKALGFTNGYITIFKGDIDSLIDWFHEEPKCRYHNFWGWYIVSTDELPQIPAGLEPIQLKWEDVAFADEEQLRPESEIREYIDSLVYDPSPSRWQGNIGDRITRYLTVTKITELPDGYYGPSSFYLFEDEDKNEYTWTTAARKLELGETYEVVGSIKSLQKYKGKEQTVLTRCRIN